MVATLAQHSHTGKWVTPHLNDPGWQSAENTVETGFGCAPRPVCYTFGTGLQQGQGHDESATARQPIQICRLTA